MMLLNTALAPLATVRVREPPLSPTLPLKKTLAVGFRTALVVSVTGAVKTVVLVVKVATPLRLTGLLKVRLAALVCSVPPVKVSVPLPKFPLPWAMTVPALSTVPPLKLLLVVLRKTLLLPATTRLPLPMVGPLRLVLPLPAVFWNSTVSPGRKSDEPEPEPIDTVLLELLTLALRVMTAPEAIVSRPLGLIWALLVVAEPLVAVLTLANTRAPTVWRNVPVMTVAVAVELFVVTFTISVGLPVSVAAKVPLGIAWTT